jgi:hypothetical protein
LKPIKWTGFNKKYAFKLGLVIGKSSHLMMLKPKAQQHSIDHLQILFAIFCDKNNQLQPNL